MSKVRIKELFQDKEKYSGSQVTVSGWARSIRDMKAYGFIDLNDGTSFKGVQIVLEENNVPNFKDIVKQNVGAALVITGTLKITDGAKQPFEIVANEIIVEGESTPEYPLQKKRHSPEFLRTIAHLRPRTNLYNAVFRIRSVTSHLIHSFFQERDFVNVHSPIITCSDAEGAGEMFHVTTLDLADVPKDEDGAVNYGEDFFGKQASLTVSGQLNAEAYALAFSNVYTFGPTFRAENSNTPRHVAEFWMIEPEIAFADLTDDMQLAEDMLKYVISGVLDKCKDELEFLNNFVDKGLLERLNTIVNAEFAHVTYTQAIDILLECGEQFEFPVYWGCDLQTEHERYLTEKHYKKPVFVTDYPKDIKAFYMRLNDDGKTVAAMDLLAPGIGEIIGGSQREERLDVLEKRIEEMGLDKETYWWYLELRKYGGTKHAGFGLGFERLLMYITGVSNIRDVLPFPRTVGSSEF
ncbi:MAG: asparagine--tRNA ligase [Oscillospiraceae bacterium]|nr:asparagine--tRNA ligase [Oscillospiraceae bacterium]